MVKFVISAKPIHHLMVSDAPVWGFEELDKWMRSFFRAAKGGVNGGQCLVACNTICRSTCFGEPGVKNL